MLTKYSAIVIAVFGFSIQNATAGNEQAVKASDCYQPYNGQTYASCPIPVAVNSVVRQAWYVPVQYDHIKWLGPNDTQRNEQFVDPKNRQ